MSGKNVLSKNPVPKNFQQNTKGSAKTNTDPDNPSKTNKKEITKTALFSTKNVYWPGVGKIAKGYNIVKKDFATKWLTLDYIREASPEEISREFGV
jgi:hypothetical protein